MRTGGKTVRWPRGMELGVNDRVQPINMLLFVREAWSLASDVELPTLSPAPSIGGSSLPQPQDLEIWDQRWHLQWERTWAWYGLEKPRETPTPSTLVREYSRLGQEMNQNTPPFWFVEYGFEGIDQEAFYAWDSLITAESSPLNTKECLSELIAAWETGLSSIMSLPYSGYYANRLNGSKLVVSKETLLNPELFKVALNDWIKAA